jgi:hypothetical protein
MLTPKPSLSGRYVMSRIKLVCKKRSPSEDPQEITEFIAITEMMIRSARSICSGLVTGSAPAVHPGIVAAKSTFVGLDSILLDKRWV